MSEHHFSIPIRVYIEDTDAGGIVFYVNYLKYMERARTEFMRQLGYDKPAVLSDDALLVVHSANVQYRQPAKLDDQLQVTAGLSKLAKTYVIFEQQVWRNEELLCSADIKVACVTSGSIRPRAIPSEMHSKLQACQSKE